MWLLIDKEESSVLFLLEPLVALLVMPLVLSLRLYQILSQ